MAPKGKTVIVGSKLPMGLILQLPEDLGGTKVELRGLNSMPKGMDGRPVATPYVTTEVDADFWTSWKLLHCSGKDSFKPFSSGAIFECPSVDDAKRVYRERENEKTGLDALSQNAEGVKPADRD